VNYAGICVKEDVYPRENMTKSFTHLALLLAFAGFTIKAQGASVAGLADWCVNLNGDINTACNGAGSGGTSTNPPGGSISLASFSKVLEPGTNTLGSVTINLGVGNNQSVGFYADYDLDFLAFGAFQDFATVVGAVPAGVTYEADNPNSSNIFSDFAGNALPNVNNVGTAAGPAVPCCDVAFALAIGGVNVPSGGTGTVTFTVGTTVPTTGFYVRQKNFDLSDSIYLSESVVVTSSTGMTPEPSTFVLSLGVLGALIAAKRRNTKSLEDHR
jgi:hypothetical protein